VPVAAQVLDGVDACLTVGETEAIVHGAHQVGQLSGAPGAAGDRGMISNVQLAVGSETVGRQRLQLTRHVKRESAPAHMALRSRAVGSLYSSRVERGRKTHLNSLLDCLWPPWGSSVPSAREPDGSSAAPSDIATSSFRPRDKASCSRQRRTDRRRRHTGLSAVTGLSSPPGEPKDA
jgi:hypothetical protein